MPLEHEEAQPQKDSTSTGDQIAANKGGDTGQRLPPASTPPQPPEPPAPHEPAPEQPYKWRRDLKLGIEFLGLTALIVYTVFSILQWAQIRWTNRLTREALNGSNETLRQTTEKMQLQANAMNRLAKATEDANANVIDSDRPWLGSALAIDQDVAVGNNPTVTILFQNSGKRPARVIDIEAQPNLFTIFPKNPPYTLKPNGRQSASFLVPGAGLNLKLKVATDKIDDHLLASLTGAKYFYIYSRIVYIDVRTNVVHHTYSCWKYNFKETPETVKGFLNCPIADGYNDAD